MNNTVKFTLNENEAIVLFDWLKRFNEREDITFEDQAEERVLWDIEALLEKSLVLPFSRNYQKLLMKARNAVRDDE